MVKRGRVDSRCWGKKQTSFEELTAMQVNTDAYRARSELASRGHWIGEPQA
jgi:hypothetical protein